MIRVYRMQDADGRGPWRPGLGHLWSDQGSTIHLDHSFQPFNPQSVQNALKASPTLRYFGFGCRTVDALRDWFTPKELDTLLGMGFRAVELEAERMLLENRRQLLFARSKPLTVDARPIRFADDGSQV